MSELRGVPFRRGIQFVRAIRRPTRLLRYALLAAGPIGVIIAALIMPLIEEMQQWWTVQMEKFNEENRFNLGRIQEKAEQEKEDLLFSAAERQKEDFLLSEGERG
jgi:hypothetical protein